MFKKAELFLTNPTIALTGPTGSGKTFSALRLASGIAKAMDGRFAVIDAENGSASLYSRLFDFDTLNLTPPFTTDKYIEAIKIAEKCGYVALVCDSITHAWAGEGGLLEQKAQLDARPGSNHWTNWGPIKAKDQKFRNAYLHSTIPFFIATMRSKMEYAQTENNGKKKVEKQGMAPVQSDGIEYEFSLVLDIAMNHEAEVGKDRTHLFDQKPIFKIDEEIGKMLVDWRSGGKLKPPVIKEDVNPHANAEMFTDHFPEDDLGNVFGDIDSQDMNPRDIAGEHLVGFGVHGNLKIREMNPAILKSYCDFLVDQSRKSQKTIDPNGKVGKLLHNAAIYLGV